MLTKHQISSGDYLESFSEIPKEMLWTLDRIESSMQETLAVRPEGGELWVFGYGSLLWNPLLSFSSQERATLHGWRRSFCMRIIAGRATAEMPGRMLALEPGGFTQGMAFQLTKQAAQEELILLWIREMLTGAYRPIWAPLTLDGGAKITALVFVAEPNHPHYECDSSVKSAALSIASAAGWMGSNAEYVHRLKDALAEFGFIDEYIAHLSEEINS